MRVKFRWIYIGVSFVIFLVFILAVVLFYLYGLRFDSEKPNPYDNGTNISFLVGGIIVFIFAMILGIVICGIYFPLLYKKSRDIYMETEEYKTQVHKYSEIDLIKFTFRELK
jgi:cytochrome c biogenesis factor